MNKNHRSIITISRFIVLSLFAVVTLNAQIKINKNLPDLVLRKDKGGNINGNEWKSSDLKNKLNIVFYVAPNQQKDVESLLNKIDSKAYSRKSVQVTMVINTEATWIPIGIIEGKVKGRAKEDATKSYVLDNDEVLLKGWNLSEDNPNIIVVDATGKVISFFNEKLTDDIANKLLSIIEKEIKKEGVLK
jgi:predicted transcriptional regulator